MTSAQTLYRNLETIIRNLADRAGRNRARTQTDQKPGSIERRDTMVENIMKLHRCADCPIRCRAVAKPHSLFARIHNWHMTWWPGWKIYLRELRAHRAEARGRDAKAAAQA